MKGAFITPLCRIQNSKVETVGWSVHVDTNELASELCCSVIRSFLLSFISFSVPHPLPPKAHHPLKVLTLISPPPEGSYPDRRPLPAPHSKTSLILSGPDELGIMGDMGVMKEDPSDRPVHPL